MVATMNTEPWVTLAGVFFRVASRRRYGRGTSVVLRTSEGKAYRLAEVPSLLERSALRYLHDATIDGEVYKVFVAPPDSSVARTLSLEPVSVAGVAPCLLESATHEEFSLRRTNALDGRPAVSPNEPPKDGLSPELEAEVARIAESRGVSAEVALDYIVQLGLRRLAATAKHSQKRQRKKKK